MIKLLSASKFLQWHLLLFMSLLISEFVPLSFPNSQASSPWSLVKKFPARPYKAIHLDRDQEPDVVLRSPILEDAFFTDDLNGWAIGNIGTIARTSDGGLTWTSSTVDIPGYLSGIFFCNARKGWVIGNHNGQGSILKTEDGGATWHTQKGVEGFELSGFRGVWFVDERHGWIVGEAQQEGIVRGIIIATQDGGEHWRLQFLSEKRIAALSAVRFSDKEHGWAIGSSSILYTDDGGQHWREKRYEPGEYFEGIDFLNPAEGWIVGSSGLVLHTTNGGEEWNKYQLPLKQQRLWIMDVKFVNPKRGWIAGDNGLILATKDGGKTWEVESEGATNIFRKLASTSQCIVALGNNGVILRRKL
jgi:photosystem II stability/assembly factor-like uncharacterized protein